jgi:hypothetical protein
MQFMREARQTASSLLHFKVKRKNPVPLIIGVGAQKNLEACPRKKKFVPAYKNTLKPFQRMFSTKREPKPPRGSGPGASGARAGPC